jgi:hypothetical protein
VNKIDKFLKNNKINVDNMCLEIAMQNKLPKKIIMYLLSNKCVPTDKVMEMCGNKEIFILKMGLKNCKQLCNMQD